MIIIIVIIADQEKFGCAQRVGFLSSIPRPPVSFLLPSEQEGAKHTKHSGCLYIHIYVYTYSTFGLNLLTFLKPFWIFYIFPSTFFSTKVCIYPFPPEVKLIAIFWPECNLYQSVCICHIIFVRNCNCLTNWRKGNYSHPRLTQWLDLLMLKTYLSFCPPDWERKGHIFLDKKSTQNINIFLNKKLYILTWHGKKGIYDTGCLFNWCPLKILSVSR